MLEIKDYQDLFSPDFNVLSLRVGSMDDDFNVFNNMEQSNLTSLDTMITGLAKNGLGEDVVNYFSRFKRTGLKPDGMLPFESMINDYGIIPSMKHFVSTVNMLGSTGYLHEALEFIEKMPMEASVDVWETMNIVCRIHGNLELDDLGAELVEQLDPSCLNEKTKLGLVPVKASNIVKEKKKERKYHDFQTGDTSHPESDKIYALIRDREGKEEALLAHSEILAVSQGLLRSHARATIRIVMDFRIYGDCHAAMKIISKIVGRELVIQTEERFHHFKDGLCSCRDYW
ncbi:pentatricopeptide repeat-containing protein At4g32450, mitochondrial-like [Pistacia vera]|uniref:pentatricopeptide repeat-containing protein At4g32450, mitochondrial-like n=1 Tax=Pistacia vera TaxID=55513 RepID=UPI0012632EEF|nr:pentatricopeptide repeat-containing protein At4g32450, mitochondrial-like [Pistacia vera]